MKWKNAQAVKERRRKNSMVKNNIELDVKVKCLEANMTQQQVGETIGTTGQYVNRVLKKKEGIVNKTFGSSRI